MAENSASVAQDMAAPVAERHDAQVEFHKSHGLSGLAAELFPASDVQRVIDQMQSMHEEADLAKAARGNLIKGPWKQRESNVGGQSVFLDQFQLLANGQYWDRPGVLGFDGMRAMVDQTPILNSIVMTRIRQVNRFCRPQSGRTDAGFTIKHVDPSVELGADKKKLVQNLQRFIVNCGWETDPRARKRLKRDSFGQFMAKITRDTLTMDAAPIETEFKRDAKLGMDGFYAVDGATIRLCSEEGYEGDDEVFALQVIQGQIRTAYTYDDLIYEVRNPRTDVTACGYGYSETEMLIRVVTYLLNAMTYNGSFFDKNSIPRGVLNLFGNYDANDLAAFKRYWAGMVRGAQNVHNMPVLVSKDVESKAQFEEIGGQLNEMAFAKWLTFLTSISCAIYGTAPEEISMESFAASKSALAGSDTEEKLVSSSDKGLRPLLGYVENTISDYILQVYDPDLVFRFTGLDAEDGQRNWERQKLSLTWNEMRSQDGMDPIKGDLGDAPMNPSLLGVWQAETGVGQPADDFGDPDEGGPPGEDADGAQDPRGQPEGAAGAKDDESDGGPDFGRGDGEADMAKAMSGAAFGMPIYSIEA